MKTHVLIATTAFFVSTAYADPTARWYSDQQVKAGGPLFATHCAGCHGANAEGTKEWRKRDAQGRLPPPPLNGTAHTWHHPYKILHTTIQKGGARVGGVMPAFADKLNYAEILSIIAWFQSLWPDEIYTRWLERDELSQTGG